MTSRTIVDQVECQPSGHIGIRFIKQQIDEAGRVTAWEYHRTAIEPGGDIDAAFALVNAHLPNIRNGLASAPVEAWGSVHAVRAAVAAEHGTKLIVNFTDRVIVESVAGEILSYREANASAFSAKSAARKSLGDAVFPVEEIKAVVPEGLRK